MVTGYSGTALPVKLGIKPGMKLIVLDAPWEYRRVVRPLPMGVTIAARASRQSEFIHWFVKDRADVEAQLPKLAETLADTGSLWVSWPKKASRVGSTHLGGRRSAVG
jgi:hypothetical protein